MIAFIPLFFSLMCGHALADFALQSEFMARNKRRKLADPGLWLPSLVSHGLIHGGCVMLATGSPWLGMAETAAHCLIDTGKCESLYGNRTDQSLHVLCKVVWAAMVLG